MEDLKLSDEIVPLAPGVAPLPQLIMNRGLGFKRNGPQLSSVEISRAAEVAEERLISRNEFEITPCKLASQSQAPVLGQVGGPWGMGGQQSSSTRSTFLMVFSPDRELIASTHGDHNIYISRAKDGSCLKILQGHPRTPWCVAFHPSQKGILASGCLGGHVRVWDLHGGSEFWFADGVIASLAFHPTDRLLVIATLNELHFWDWSRPEPFTKVCTKNIREKVRYVQFDSLGHQLITGIANLSQQHQNLSQQEPVNATESSRSSDRNSSAYSFYQDERRRLLERYERIMNLYYSNLQGQSSSDASFFPLPSDSWRIRQRQGGSSNNPSSFLSGSPSSETRAIRDTENVRLPVSYPSREEFLSTSTAQANASSASTQTPSSASVTVQNSASQTLSDLAQAASNQLMAENATSINSNDPMQTTTNETLSERDDPFLSDHPYGMRPARAREASLQADGESERMPRGRENRITSRHFNTAIRRQLMNGFMNGLVDPDLVDNLMDETTPASAAMDEASGNRTSTSFSHSPESEFVEVTHLHPSSRSQFYDSDGNARISNASGRHPRADSILTEYYRNPDRSPPDEANMRFRSLRERRLRELLDRRQALVSQIERLRSARDLLTSSYDEYTNVNSTPAPSRMMNNANNSGLQEIGSPVMLDSSPGQTLQIRRTLNPGISNDASVNSDHNYGQRPIDDWAAGRMRDIEADLASGRNSFPRQRENIGDGSQSPTSIDPIHQRPSLRRSTSSLRMIPPRIHREADPAYEFNPSVVNYSDAEALANSVVINPLSHDQQQDNNEDGPNHVRNNDDNNSLIDRQNLDIVLLGRHIEHMQQICRSSLLDMAGRRQRRQYVRLQSIRRMLEHLQREIRSLRQASSEELNLRTLQARYLRSALNRSVQASTTTTSDTTNQTRNREDGRGSTSSGQRSGSGSNGQSASSRRPTSSNTFHLARRRATAAVSRLRRSNNRLGARNQNGSAASEEASNSSASTSNGNTSLSRLLSPATTGSAARRRSRGKLTRTYNQTASQLRATFRAMEMSPDLARPQNNLLNRRKAEASQVVMENTEQASTSNETKTVSHASTENRNQDSGSKTKNELRALSQRLERMLRERREAEEAMNNVNNVASSEERSNEEACRRDERESVFRRALMLLDNPYESSSPSTNNSSQTSTASLLSNSSTGTSFPPPVNSGSSNATRNDAEQREHLRSSRIASPETSQNATPTLNESSSNSRGTRTAHRPLFIPPLTGWDNNTSEPESDSSDSSLWLMSSQLRNTASSSALNNLPTGSRRLTRSGRWTRYDFPSSSAELNRISSLRRQGSLNRSRLLGPREWRPWEMPLDVLTGLRRNADSERRRLNRERDISRRRRQERPLSQLISQSHTDPVSAERSSSTSSLGSLHLSDGILDPNNDRLPPLRELIWRRLRRRNAQLNLVDDEIVSEASRYSPPPTAGVSRDRSRHREMLSWMVDQLTIDQQQQQLNGHRNGNGNSAMVTPPPPLPSSSSGSSRRSSTIQSSSNTASNPGSSNNLPNRQFLFLRDRGNNPSFGTMGPHYRDGLFLYHTPSNMLLTHRIQSWDFSKGNIPDISDSSCNVVVKEAKIHNDASVDISQDGTILVTLVPSNLPMTTVVGVYSLATNNRGTCYATSSLESSAVSVSLSPTSRHLLVGLTSRASRLSSLSPAGADSRGLMAQVFRIMMPWEVNGVRGRLIHRRDIPQSEQGLTALNCIRWIPVAGQGIVYATNTGLLKILR